MERASQREMLHLRGGRLFASLILAAMIAAPVACSVTKTPKALAAPTNIKALITISVDADKNILSRKRIIAMDDPRQLATLSAFFPEMNAGKKSPMAGAWMAGATIEFFDASGAKVRVMVSANDGYKTWSEGNGDWQVRGDFSSYLQQLETAQSLAFFDVCRIGTPGEVETQIRAGADVNEEDKDGCTPLIAAALHNSNPDVITLLAKAGAVVNARARCGEAMEKWREVNHEHADIIERLTKAESQDDAGWTALLAAAMGNTNPAVIEALLKAGAEVNGRGYCGCTAAILTAARNPNPEVAAALARAGADMNAEDEFGYTPLMWAVGRNANPKMIIGLVEAGAKINRQDREGRTALMGATDNKNAAVIATLVKAGADITVKDNEGRTAMDYARRYGNDSMPVKALEKATRR